MATLLSCAMRMSQHVLGHLVPPEAQPTLPGLISREISRRLREVRTNGSALKSGLLTSKATCRGCSLKSGRCGEPRRGSSATARADPATP